MFMGRIRFGMPQRLALVAFLGLALVAGLLVPSFAAAGPNPSCRGKAATIVLKVSDQGKTVFGTAGNDVVVGTQGPDIYDSFGGNDVVCLLGGDDTFFGSPYGRGGNDIVEGGNGNDYLGGGKGNDKLFGQIGDDRFSGGTGNDECNGGANTDKVFQSPDNFKCEIVIQVENFG
jgi:Ca2+-binding RTX toxin-like protein